MRQKGKIWKDATGKEVDTWAINPVLKLEERYAHKVANKALMVEKYLKELNEIIAEAYTEIAMAKAKDAEIKGNKYNAKSMGISSFDETIEVKITKPASMYFDNTYTDIVLEKFNEYFNSLNTDSETGKFIRQLVQDLIKTTGGRLDSTKVWQLRRYRTQLAKNKKIKNAHLFIDAVDTFDKAVRKKQGNTGVHVYVAKNVGEKKRKLALKIQDV